MFLREVGKRKPISIAHGRSIEPQRGRKDRLKRNDFLGFSRRGLQKT